VESKVTAVGWERKVGKALVFAYKKNRKSVSALIPEGKLSYKEEVGSE
jgi:hypothetical protein